ncbi:STK31-like protein [Mya arenaria]|uniref:STK31-like protein n=1 Tax=Mya arenaria TaxID=6604 RepID=A0ABY7DEF6_MYAAR|nr:STK31-like protein [Mya arenaria]
MKNPHSQLSLFDPLLYPHSQLSRLFNLIINNLVQVYACLYTEDNTWYRCQVRQCFGTDKPLKKSDKHCCLLIVALYKIQYIDYGNIEEVGAGSLVEIPASLSSFRPLATKIVLHNTRAKDLSDKQAS